MKITKDTARQVPTADINTPLVSRNENASTEPVHTIVADRDTQPLELPPFGQMLERAQHADRGAQTSDPFRAIGSSENQTPGKVDESNGASPNPLPPWGEERRKGDRRQRQVDVLLDTRITYGRRLTDRSINVKV